MASKLQVAPYESTTQTFRGISLKTYYRLGHLNAILSVFQEKQTIPKNFENQTFSWCSNNRNLHELTVSYAHRFLVPCKHCYHCRFSILFFSFMFDPKCGNFLKGSWLIHQRLVAIKWWTTCEHVSWKGNLLTAVEFFELFCEIY